MSNNNYELIMTICNQGFADDIMISAKLAGARGGTIIHARGTATEEAIKFLGITIQPEKEILLIVTNFNSKEAIMQAITSNHGLNTDARALCFSLPVTDVCGFNI